MKLNSGILFCASSLLMSAHGASVRMCYKRDFVDCIDVAAPHGDCVYVPTRYNDHVFSASTPTGHHCDSYDTGCEPGSLLIQGIDRAGYQGLPEGHRVSGFRCYD